MADTTAKRARGEGRIFKRGTTCWIQFYSHGRQVRESAGTDDEKKAAKILRKKMGEVEAGVHRDLRQLRYEDLREAFLVDYKVNRRKSLRFDKKGDPYLDKVARLRDRCGLDSEVHCGPTGQGAIERLNQSLDLRATSDVQSRSGGRQAAQRTALSNREGVGTASGFFRARTVRNSLGSVAGLSSSAAGDRLLHRHATWRDSRAQVGSNRFAGRRHQPSRWPNKKRRREDDPHHSATSGFA